MTKTEKPARLGKEFKYFRKLSYDNPDITQILKNQEMYNDVHILNVVRILTSDNIIKVLDFYKPVLKDGEVPYIAFLVNKKDKNKYFLGHVSKIPEEHAAIGYYKSGTQECVVPTIFVMREGKYITINGI